MRQDVTDVDPLPLVLNFGDQPVLVPADVEHRVWVNKIGLWIRLSYIYQTFPRG